MILWKSVKRRPTIDIKTPPPAHLLREHSPQNWSNRRRKSPHHAHHTKILTSLPHTKQITDTNIDQNNQAAAPHALNRPRRDQHAHGDTDRCQQAADEEHDGRAQQDGFPAPDVRELAPGRRAGGVGQHVRRSDPRVAGAGAEVLADGGQRGGDDGGVEGGEEDGCAEGGHDDDDLEASVRGFGVGSIVWFGGERGRGRGGVLLVVWSLDGGFWDGVDLFFCLCFCFCFCHSGSSVVCTSVVCILRHPLFYFPFAQLPRHLCRRPLISRPVRIRIGRRQPDSHEKSVWSFARSLSCWARASSGVMQGCDEMRWIVSAIAAIPQAD